MSVKHLAASSPLIVDSHQKMNVDSHKSEKVAVRLCRFKRWLSSFVEKSGCPTLFEKSGCPTLFAYCIDKPSAVGA